MSDPSASNHAIPTSRGKRLVRNVGPAQWRSSASAGYFASDPVARDLALLIYTAI
jgi:hypothetical protein